MSEVKQAFLEAYARYCRYSASRSASDREAFHTAYRQAVIYFVRRHIPPPAQMGTYVATDFVNDTFLKLDKEAVAGREFAGVEDLQRFALRVVKNSIFDYLRSRQVRRKALDPRALDDIPVADPTCEAAFLNLETMVRIAEAIRELKRLDPKAAEIADRYVFGAQEEAEIAAEMDISRRTVSRAMIRLRARLTD